ncbi:MAG: enolase C-terminal domain-like protein [Rhabdochlamydiaceae bacterium]
MVDNILFKNMIHEYKIFKYSLSLQDAKREGLLLQINQNSWGEIAPLPGWSEESLDQAFFQLKRLLSDQESFSYDDCLPSVAFGIYSALELCHHQMGKVQISGLLSGSSKEVLKQAELLKKQGIKSAKLKLSPFEIKEAQSLLTDLKEDFFLRIDINRKWDLKKLRKCFSLFSSEDFDYIEEPTYEIEKLKEFPFPIAFDESLRFLDLTQWKDSACLKAIVYKPTILGTSSKIKHKLIAMNRPITLSSSYETGVGLFSILGLIHLKEMKTSPLLGVYPYFHLKEDLLTEPFYIEDGYICPPSKMSIKEDKLQLIYEGKRS